MLDSAVRHDNRLIGDTRTQPALRIGPARHILATSVANFRYFAANFCYFEGNLRYFGGPGRRRGTNR